MNDKLKNIFSDIYHGNKWGGKESRSGPGSDSSIVNKIRQIIWDMHDLNSILNIPCGDQEWHKDAKKYGFQYIGADIVPELIEANRNKWPGVDFRVLDITTDELPTVDLVFVRDLFGHLSHENVFKALNNIKRSGSRYLLTTSFTNKVTNKSPMSYTSNTGVESRMDGGWYPINVCIEPFNLIPIYLINESCTEGNGAYRDKCLMLFEVENIPNYQI